MEKYSHINFSRVIDVAEWDRTEEVPTGSREKTTVIEPETGRHHIHKYPKERREHQIWSELLASYIAGDLLGWKVQHTSIAVKGDRPGNLLGFVYEPGSKTATQETFTEGWQFCTQIDPFFDVDKGTRHTLPLIIQVCDDLLVPHKKVSRRDFMDYWGQALALDTLISNTDRHAENWAIVEGPDGVRMAALYDNGSSLGCGIDQVGLDRAFHTEGRLKDEHLEKQRQNGCHHLRLDEPAQRGGKFEDVCVAFLRHYPDGKRWFEATEGVNIDAVCRVMAAISERTCLSEPYALSERRRQHIYAMLQIGMERIRNVLCGA